MARSMSALAKPMLSMLAMAASRSPPMVRAEGSLNWRDVSDVCAGAGEGVAGAFWAVDDEGAGAAGGAGVWAAFGAGVEGAALLDEAAEGFGCGDVSGRSVRAVMAAADLGDHADDEALLLDVVRFYRVRILQDFAWTGSAAAGPCGSGERTGVDQLLLRHVPALLCLDLRLELANLRRVSGARRMWQWRWCTVSDGSASMTNLFCFRSCRGVSYSWGGIHNVRGEATLNVIFIVAGRGGAGVSVREDAGGRGSEERGCERELQARRRINTGRGRRTMQSRRQAGNGGGVFARRR